MEMSKGKRKKIEICLNEIERQVKWLSYHGKFSSNASVRKRIMKAYKGIGIISVNLGLSKLIA